MTKPSFDRQFWEQLWEKTIRDHAAIVANRPPNAHLQAETALLPPSRALDAGCGHGAESLWLASQDWSVTAPDFVATALAHGQSAASVRGKRAGIPGSESLGNPSRRRTPPPQPRPRRSCRHSRTAPPLKPSPTK